MISTRTRAGTRVRFEPTPASYLLYSSPPRRGATGAVTSVSLGGRRRSYLPGPGGGLLYVKWDDGSFQGVSTIDLVKVRGAHKENPPDAYRNWLRDVARRVGPDIVRDRERDLSTLYVAGESAAEAARVVARRANPQPWARVFG